jgi:hypothetical protein
LTPLHNKHFDIIQNCFQANKPAYLVLQKAPPQADEGDDKLTEKEKVPKLKKLKLYKDREPKDFGNIIENSNPVKEWIVSKTTNSFSTRVWTATSYHSMTPACLCVTNGFLEDTTLKNVRGRLPIKISQGNLKQDYMKWVKEIKDKSPHNHLDG